jgi:hypothetical protein
MGSDISVSNAVELLAPVPADLLQDASAFANDGEVAFGSRAWEVFRELDFIRGDRPVRVWIYASHDPERPLPPTVTWAARYVRHIESIGGAHPEGKRYRSERALLEQDIAYWAVYWHVDNLRQLDPSEWRPTSDFRGYGKPAPYQRPFEPEGPLLVEPTRP